MIGIEELINSSLCFGQAYDGTVKECKMCEVRLKCKAKCEGVAEDVKKPEAVDVAEKSEVTFDDAVQEKKPAEKKAKKLAKANNKKSVEYADDMPDLKAMTQDEIEVLAKDRGINLADYDRYSNASIKRMRLTMAIKKTYEK